MKKIKKFKVKPATPDEIRAVLKIAKAESKRIHKLVEELLGTFR